MFLLLACSSELVPVASTIHDVDLDESSVTASDFHARYWEQFCAEAAKCDDASALAACDQAPVYEPARCPAFDADLAAVCLDEPPTCGGDRVQVDATCRPSQVCGAVDVAPLTCGEPESTEPNDGELGIWVDDGYHARLSLHDDDVDAFRFEVPPHTRFQLTARFEPSGGDVQLGMFVGAALVDEAGGSGGRESVVFQNVGDGWMPVSVEAVLSGRSGCVLYDVDVELRPL